MSSKTLFYKDKENIMNYDTHTFDEGMLKTKVSEQVLNIPLDKSQTERPVVYHRKCSLKPAEKQLKWSFFQGDHKYKIAGTLPSILKNDLISHSKKANKRALHTAVDKHKISETQRRLCNLKFVI